MIVGTGLSHMDFLHDGCFRKMLSHFFGSKVHPSGRATCINGTTPHRNIGRKYGGVEERNTVGKYLGGCRSD